MLVVSNGVSKCIKSNRVLRQAELSLMADLQSLTPLFWCWDFYCLKEAIFLCNMMGLPHFGKEGSGTPVFNILVRALGNTKLNLTTGKYISMNKAQNYNVYAHE